MRTRIFTSLAIAGLISGCIQAAAGSDDVSGEVPVHIMLPAITGTPGHAPHSLVLGGPADAAVVIHLNLADVRHTLLDAGDLKDASLTLHPAADPTPVSDKTSGKGTRLAIYRLLRDVASPDQPKPDDYEKPEIASAAINSADPKSATTELHGSLCQLLAQQLAHPEQDHGLILKLESNDPDSKQPLELFPVPSVIPAEGSHVASLQISIAHHPNAQLFTFPTEPKDDTYVTVQNGHLMYGSERLRLWGVCRHFWGGAPVVDRLRQMGFNAIRLWGPRNAYTIDSARAGVMRPDEGGLEDGDSLASFDQFFADAKQRGFFMLMAGTHYDPLGIMRKGTVDGLVGATADGSFLAEQFGTGADWESWKSAITKLTDEKKSRTWHEVSELMYFDPRLREIYRRHTIAILNHVNPYTHLKYADEPAIAVWELNNEQGFVSLTSSYGIGDWPPYFRQELADQWCQWLSDRYKTDDALRAAWGPIRPGETLQGNHQNIHVELAPFLKQRNDYPAARGADVMHFLCDIATSFDDEMRKTIRAQAKPGIGAAVVPIIGDTISEPSVPWMFTESRDDVMSFGTYQFTFHSSLTVPPALFIMDNQSVLGKPTVIYETMADRPCPFRAEYPFRVAALASSQDWDGVFWHYWKGETGQADEGYLAAPMDYGRVGYMDGGIYPDQDPALCAALSVAGQSFLHAQIAPAPAPVVKELSLNDVYSYAKANGVEMRRDTFTTGAVASFVESPHESTAPTNSLMSPPTYPTGPVRCGQQIIYDWQNGRLIIDSPEMKAYVGQAHGAYRFSDGIVLQKISTPFIAFAMESADQRPLVSNDGARQILYTAQFDARNAGAIIDLSAPRGGESSGWDGGWSDLLAMTVKNCGYAPALADPISFEIDMPFKMKGSAEQYDFALRRVNTSEIDGNVVTQQGPAVYMSRLNIDSRGQTVQTPQSDVARPTDPVAAGASNPLDRPNPALATMYSPLPLVDWGEGFDEVQENIRDSTLVRSSISKSLVPPKDQGTILLKDAQPLIGLPASAAADLELRFDAAGRLNAITATFVKNPPAMDAIVAAYHSPLGDPQRDDAGVMTWTQRRDGSTVTVTVDPRSDPLQIDYRAEAR